MKARRFLLALAAAAALVSPAQARVDEARVGIVGNVRYDHGELVSGKNEGANIEAELVWTSPAWLHFLGAPRPYAMVSLASDDDGVDFGGVGLYWRWRFAERWALEPGFGYIVHDGKISDPYPLGSSQYAAFEADNNLLGSRDLFRDSIALERTFDDRFAAQLYWEHMSHGEVLGQGRNQGMDYIGLRGVFRFNLEPAT